MIIDQSSSEINSFYDSNHFLVLTTIEFVSKWWVTCERDGDGSLGLIDAARLLLGVAEGGISETTSGLDVCPLSSYTLSYYNTMNY